jgi:hypothetical protein
MCVSELSVRPIWGELRWFRDKHFDVWAISNVRLEPPWMSDKGTGMAALSQA